MTRIGQDESKQLHLVPAHAEVHITVRPKFACRACGELAQAPAPDDRPIERGLPTAGTIAQVVIAKYLNHMPLHRQAAHYARLGVLLAPVAGGEDVDAHDLQLRRLHRPLVGRPAVPGVPLFIYDNTETTWVEITPAKANKIIEAIAPNPLAGIKVSFIAYDKLLGYVYQLPKSTGVFPGGIFSLYTGYSVGVRGAT